MQSCYFLGNSATESHIAPVLNETVKRYITEYDVREFIVGSYGGFDYLAAQAVIAAKEIYPDIKLILLVTNTSDESLPEGFDGVFLPSITDKQPKWYASILANRQVIDKVDHLITYAWRSVNHLRELLEYARLREQRGQLKIEEL